MFAVQVQGEDDISVRFLDFLKRYPESLREKAFESHVDVYIESGL